MHVFALELEEAGLETSQGSWKGGERLVGLWQGRVSGPLATQQLALDVSRER